MKSEDTKPLVTVGQELAGVVEALALLDWRRRYLGIMGLEPGLALRVSLDPTIDLHVLVQMVDEDWPADIAAGLLAGGARGRVGGRG